MAPSMAYLFADPQPAMNMAMVFTDVTPSTNRMPMLSRPKKLFSPNGTTATTMSVGTSSASGASSITQRSRGVGRGVFFRNQLQ